ncbi:restriction endonuclease subunit S [Oscillospiraceae bacterium DSM 107454]|uniref:Restriction endonuclease subunit S n=2 Tax=Ructibacterium gallinarum TaxID=2779355 RepID=A0A9D5RCT5_9FIRM|nr:restriction endonuclease subunit S [Ructibacterium gallinarum]
MSAYPMLFRICKAAIGQANINAQEMQNIGLYLPPIERQQQFVQFKEQVDKSKVVVQKSLEQAETLKKALMQKYFG